MFLENTAVINDNLLESMIAVKYPACYKIGKLAENPYLNEGVDFLLTESIKSKAEEELQDWLDETKEKFNKLKQNAKDSHKHLGFGQQLVLV